MDESDSEVLLSICVYLRSSAVNMNDPGQLRTRLVRMTSYRVQRQLSLVRFAERKDASPQPGTLLVHAGGKRTRAAPDLRALLKTRTRIRTRRGDNRFMRSSAPLRRLCPGVDRKLLHFLHPSLRWSLLQQSHKPALARRNLVPEITAALAVESDDKARRSMELDMRMLRDGHWVRPESPGRICVTARLHNGISSKTVSDQELATKGLEVILAELRA